MSIKDRGFGSMDRAKVSAIASLGGIAAHKKGTAHEWTPDEARLAGCRGGKVSRARAAAKKRAVEAGEAAQ